MDFQAARLRDRLDGLYRARIWTRIGGNDRNVGERRCESLSISRPFRRKRTIVLLESLGARQDRLRVANQQNGDRAATHPPMFAYSNWFLMLSFGSAFPST